MDTIPHTMIGDIENFAKFNRLNETTIALGNAKRYLADTDYVVIKIYEAKINGEDTLPLETEYADVLAERKRVRATIDGLEAELEAAKKALENE